MERWRARFYEQDVTRDYPRLENPPDRPSFLARWRDGALRHDADLRKAWSGPPPPSLEDRLFPRIENWKHALLPGAKGSSPSNLDTLEADILDALSSVRREKSQASGDRILGEFWKVREASLTSPSIVVEADRRGNSWVLRFSVRLVLTTEQREAIYAQQACEIFRTHVWIKIVWRYGASARTDIHELWVDIQSPGECEAILEGVALSEPVSAFIRAQHPGGTFLAHTWRSEQWLRSESI